MHIRPFLAVALALGLGACSTKPELIPIVNGMPAPDDAAMAEDKGVRLEIYTDAWNGIPTDLGDDFTPVLVTLTNDSDRSVRIRYSDFMLHGPTGQRFRALPPFRVNDTVSESVDNLSYRGFLVAPYLSGYYPRVRAYHDPFFYDRYYYDTYYPAFVDIRMPTPDMIERALPEGVLEPGGSISGFLYFEDPPDKIGQVLMTQALVTPKGTQFGRLDIPLLTRD